MVFDADYMAHWGVSFKHEGDPVVYKKFDVKAGTLLAEDDDGEDVVLKVADLEVDGLDRFMSHHGP